MEGRVVPFCYECEDQVAMFCGLLQTKELAIHVVEICNLFKGGETVLSHSASPQGKLIWSLRYFFSEPCLVFEGHLIKYATYIQYSARVRWMVVYTMYMVTFRYT